LSVRIHVAVSCLALSQAFANPAFSLTPDDVWSDWQSAFSDSGLGIEADVLRSAGTLSLTNIALTLPGQSGEAPAQVTLGEITLAPAANDSVLISLPNSAPFRISSPTSDLAGSYGQQGFRMIASGVPGQTRYTYDARAFNVSLESITNRSGTAAPERLTPPITLRATEPKGQADLSLGDTIRILQTSDIAGLAFDLQMSEPTVGDVAFSFAVNDISSSSQSQIDTALVRQDGLQSARQVTTEQSFASASLAFSFKDETDSVNLQSHSQEGRGTARIDADAFSYDASARNVTLALADADLGFPLETSVDQVTFQATGPTMAQDETAPFSLALSLQSMNVPDAIWAMFDAANKLPHDPMSLDLALSGAGRFNAQSEEPELDRLAIDRFALTGIGAEITAQGAFDTDLSQRSRLGNYPKFSGQIDLTAKGVMGVLETLSDSGILPPQFVYGAALYAGMLARQVSGPDDLATTVIITPEEKVMINGQVISE
jgi:hypothetical protein